MAQAPDSPHAVKVVPSPNHGERKAGRRPDILLLHYTGMVDGLSALQRLTNPLAEVSSHYLVWEDGRIFQLVPEAARAWHAGAGAWAGVTDVNSASIGIEIVNPGHGLGYPDFPGVQVEALCRLCADIVGRWSIPQSRVLAHSDIAPRRKQDPGEKFPWDVLARGGVGHWVPPAPLADGPAYGPGDEGQPVRALQALLAVYGYALDLTGVYDAQTQAVVTAFQRHFRPGRVDGIADLSTLATLRDLLKALPERR
jgi:N-acetylmuramoyl-L-alanine amidase